MAKVTKSRGLGDDIAKFTAATGLDKMAEKLAHLAGKDDCGCSGRQDDLNKLFPRKTKPKNETK
jgi:hypothetical protein